MAKRQLRTGVSLKLACAMASLLAPPAEAAVHSVGLSAVRAQRFGGPELPNPNPDGGDAFGRAFAAGDFNGDGAEDLATGVPGSDGLSAEPRNSCGAVVVRYGVPGVGLAAGVAPTVLGQFVGAFNFSEANSQYGAALAACDINGDSFDDLVVGAPFRSVSVSLLNFANAGIIEVYFGSSAGIVPPATVSRRERGQDVNLPTEEAHFGAALACADFDDNGFDDVAVGLPFRSFGTGFELAGRVNIFSGSSAGLSTTALALDQDSAGILDSREFLDTFGAVLAAGDFDGDGFADLAVGVAFEAPTASPSVRSGAVQVLFGGSKGLATGANQLLFASDFGQANAENQFGFALAAGDFDADGKDDLVIGNPGANVASFPGAGLFFAIPGTAAGPGAGQVRIFSELELFGGGLIAANDGFGSALAAGDFDADGADDLAIGTPGQDFDGLNDGAVAILMGEVGEGLPFNTLRRRRILRGFEGYPGDRLEQLVSFGDTLRVGDFDGDRSADLAIGAPREGESLLPNVGTATVVYGTLFADGFAIESSDFWFPVVP